MCLPAPAKKMSNLVSGYAEETDIEGVYGIALGAQSVKIFEREFEPTFGSKQVWIKLQTALLHIAVVHFDGQRRILQTLADVASTGMFISVQKWTTDSLELLAHSLTS